MTNTPDEQLTEEPQAERGGPGSGEPGSRDTGSDRPSAGTADRDSGKLDDQAESSDAEDPTIYGGTGELPPQDTKPAIPPYEGRSETATNPRSGAGESGGFGTKGETARSADTSDAAKPAAKSETDEGVGPGHTPGTGRAEDKR
jgi:hypothetical protein